MHFKVVAACRPTPHGLDLKHQLPEMVCWACFSSEQPSVTQDIEQASENAAPSFVDVVDQDCRNRLSRDGGAVESLPL